MWYLIYIYIVKWSSHYSWLTQPSLHIDSMCGVRTLWDLLSTNFKYTIQHLTTVTMLHIRSPEYTHTWKLVPFDSMESWSSAVTKAEMPSSRHCFSQSCFQTLQFSQCSKEPLGWCSSVSSLMSPAKIFVTVILSGHSPLRFHDSATHLVWPHAHGCSPLLHSGGEQAQSPGMLGVWTFPDLSPWASIPHSSRWLLRLWPVVSNLKALMKSLAAVGPLWEPLTKQESGGRRLEHAYSALTTRRKYVCLTLNHHLSPRYSLPVHTERPHSFRTCGVRFC